MTTPVALRGFRSFSPEAKKVGWRQAVMVRLTRDTQIEGRLWRSTEAFPAVWDGDRWWKRSERLPGAFEELLAHEVELLTPLEVLALAAAP